MDKGNREFAKSSIFHRINFLYQVQFNSTFEVEAYMRTAI